MIQNIQEAETTFFTIINKLIPIQDLFKPASFTNGVTAYIILIGLIIFLSFSRKLFKNSKTIKNTVMDFLRENDTNKLKENDLFKNLWNDYYLNIFEFNGRLITNESASVYFNANTIYNLSFTKITDKLISLKVVNSVPSILVGLGILGTFLGLSVALIVFMPEFSNEKLDITKKASLINSKFLPGMATAFITSVWGMLLSLLFTMVEKLKTAQISRHLSRLCFELDSKYKISKKTELEILKQNQQTTLEELFTYKDEAGKQVKPGNAMREIENYSKSIASSTSQFSVDLSDKINAGFDTILQKRIENDFAPLIRDLKKELSSLFGKLNEKLENFSHEVNKPADEALSRITESLKDAMANMMGDFKESISGSTKNEMQHIATQLGEVGKLLSVMPEQLTNSSEELKSHMESVKGIITELSSVIKNGSEESAENVSKITRNLSETVDKQINDLLSVIELSSKETKEQQLHFTKQHDELLLSISRRLEEDTTRTSEVFHKRNEEMLENQAKQQLALTQSVETKIGDLLTAIELSSKDVREKQQDFVKVQEDTLTLISKRLEEESAKANDQFKIRNEEMLNYQSRQILSVSKALGEQANETREHFQLLTSHASNSVKEQIRQLMESVATIQRNGQEEAEKVFEKQQILVNQHNETLKEVNKSIVHQTQKQMGMMNETISELMNEFHSKQTVLLDLHVETISKSTEMMDKFNATVKDYTLLSNQVKRDIELLSGIQGKIAVVSSAFEGIAVKLEKSSSLTVQGQREFEKTMTDSLDGLKSNLSSIQTVMKQNTDVTNTYLNKFEVVEKGLESIFSQIEKGLHGYSTQLASETEKVVKEYSRTLATSIEGLNSLLSQIMDAVGELESAFKTAKSK